jgi:hypothetical protein
MSRDDGLSEEERQTDALISIADYTEQIVARLADIESALKDIAKNIAVADENSRRYS